MRERVPLRTLVTRHAWPHDPSMTLLLVNIDVPDIERGITFYTTAFGLRVARRFKNGFVELSGAGVPIYLLESLPGTSPFPNATLTRHYTPHWTPIHFDIIVTDLDVALERALNAGATQELPPSEHAYGRLALLRDPFGHGVCLLQFNATGYDALEEVEEVPNRTGESA